MFSFSFEFSSIIDSDNVTILKVDGKTNTVSRIRSHDTAGVQFYRGFQPISKGYKMLKNFKFSIEKTYLIKIFFLYVPYCRSLLFVCRVHLEGRRE